MIAMILAAGLGTRLKPHTDTRPKALMQVGGKTMLQRVSEKLISSGVTDIVINIHHHEQQMRSFIDSMKYPGVRFHISDETALLLDTGGGIKKAWPLLRGEHPFIVYNIDILCDVDLNKMLEAHQRKGVLATLAVSDRTATRYLLWKNGLLCGWENASTGETIVCNTPSHNDPQAQDGIKGSGKHTDGNARSQSAHHQSTTNITPGQAIHSGIERKAFSGIHVIEPAMIELMNETGVFSIKDVYLRLASTHPIACFQHDHHAWIDIGTPEKLDHARTYYENR